MLVESWMSGRYLYLCTICYKNTYVLYILFKNIRYYEIITITFFKNKIVL